MDGDTLRVAELAGNDLDRVRLLGIDAPEIAHPPADAECYADRATAELEQLTPIGATLTLTTDIGQANRDRYGRMPRYVDQVDQPGEADIPARSTRPVRLASPASSCHRCRPRLRDPPGAGSRVDLHDGDDRGPQRFTWPMGPLLRLVQRDPAAGGP